MLGNFFNAIKGGIMKQNRVLYQIKSLEKMIGRYFFKDFECDRKDFNEQEVSIPTSTQIPTPTQMQVIEYILENSEKEIYQKDLEEILNLRRATVSGVLRTMEKNELIKRTKDTEDTRTKKIILNEKAQKIFIQHEKKFKELENIITQGISQEELLTFTKVIEKMKDNIKNNQQ